MKKTLKSVALAYRQDGSDKVYNAALVQEDDGKHTVYVEWGRRGSTLSQGTKAEKVALDAAEKALAKVIKEKTSKGYKEVPNEDGKTSLVGTEKTGGREKIEGVSAQLLAPVTEEEAEKLVLNSAWIAQRKYDGVRVMAHLAADGTTRFTNRNGQVTSVIQEVEDSLKGVKRPAIIDGEIVPSEAGSIFWAFDLLTLNGDPAMRESGYVDRHEALAVCAGEAFGPNVKVAPVAYTTKEKRELVDRLKAERAEGVVFKKTDAPYSPGRSSSQAKLKFTKTADVILTKWNGKAFEMSVYEGAKLREVGKVYTGTTEDDRADLKKALAKGPVVAEVRYLYATEGDVLYQPVFVRRRSDKSATECGLGQLVRTNREVEDA